MLLLIKFPMTVVVNVLLSLQYAPSISFCRRVCDVLVQRLALIILVIAIYPQIARAPLSLLSSSSSSCIPVESALDQRM